MFYIFNQLLYNINRKKGNPSIEKFTFLGSRKFKNNWKKVFEQI